MLTALLLNYGNRLEKVVSAIKEKTEVMQLRQHNEMVNFKHLEDKREQKPQQSTYEQNQQILKLLDFRIFIVTVFISFVLIAIAVVELLCMFGVFQGVADTKQFKLAIFYTCTESLPSVLIAFYLSISITSDDAPTDHYKAVSHAANKGKESDSDDSEFGSFNPNLHALDRVNSSPLQTIRPGIELKKPLFPLNQMKLSDAASDSSRLVQWDALPRENINSSQSSASDQ